MCNLRDMRRCFQPRQWFEADGEPDPAVLTEEESFMWVYQKVSDGVFQVGYYMPDKTWCVEATYDTREKAAARVNYLNGGRHESAR